MLPEVEAYLAAMDAAEATYHNDWAKAREQYAAQRDDWGNRPEAYYAAHDRVNEARRIAKQEAARLLEGAQDPLAAWIVKNTLNGHREHSMRILKALPASLDDLNRIAREHGWCAEWARYRGRAIADGALPEVPPLERARYAIVEWSHARNYMGDTQVRRLEILMDKLAEIAIAEHEAEKAAAAKEARAAKAKATREAKAKPVRKTPQRTAVATHAV
jgi:hypothetical protein